MDLDILNDIIVEDSDWEEIDEKEYSDFSSSKIELTEKQLLKLEKKEQKAYKDAIKTIFSSLTARRCRFVYINILDDPNILIFTNGDRVEFGKFRSIELGIHVVILKDKYLEYFNKFKSSIGISNLDKPYMLIPSDYLSLSNKAKKDSTLDVIEEGGNIFSILNLNDENNTTEKKLIGSPVSSINILHLLKSFSSTLLESTTRDDIVYQDIDRDTPVVGGQLIVLDVDKPNKWKAILLEGVGTPSHKEFTKKTEGEYKLGILPIDAGINVFTKFTNEYLEVYSIKPFNYYRP